MSDPSGTSPSASLALPASTRTAPRARSMRLESRVVLFAVCGLVFLVSLPRLRGIAIHENELDALRALELFSRELDTAKPPACIGELLPEGSGLSRRLADVSTLADGALALRHGYLFELRRGSDGEQLVCAWPWRHGSTGLATFVAGPGRGVLGREAKDGDAERWSGPGARPELGALDSAHGWRRVRLPGTRTESY
jgi:hypothetical protein